MNNSSQPQVFAAASDLLAQAGWVGEPDDVAFGCECANPALQIASWGQEAGEPGPAGAAMS